MNIFIHSETGVYLIILFIVIFCIAAVWFMRKDCCLSRKLWGLMLLLYLTDMIAHMAFHWHLHVDVHRSLDILAMIPATGVSYMFFLSLIDPGRIKLKLIAAHLAPFVVFTSATLAVHILYGPVPKLKPMTEYLIHLDNPSVAVMLSAAAYMVCYELMIIYNMVTGYLGYRKRLRSKHLAAGSVGGKEILSLLCVFCVLILYAIFDMINDNAIYTVIYVYGGPVALFYLISFGIDHLYPKPSAAKPVAFALIDQAMLQLAGRETLGPVDRNGILRNRILKYMEDKKPYLNKELKASDLAYALGTNRSYISKVLNQEFSTTFYEFINKYRIRHALEQMKQNPGLTIDYFASQSGFRSRSVFFCEFKKATGCTPYKYITAIKPH